MIIISCCFFSFLFHTANKGGASNENVQQFMEILNIKTLGDSSATNSSRSCIKRATVGQLKSQAAVQLKQPATAARQPKGNTLILKLN
jgi:hypothetical protein